MKHKTCLRAAALLLTGALCCSAMPFSASAAELEPIETRFRNAWKNHTATVSVKDYGMTLSEITEKYYEALYSDAEWFYVSTTFNYLTSEAESTLSMIQIRYNASVSAAKTQKAELESKIKTLTDAVHPDWSEKETVLYFHDYLAAHCAYDFSFQNYDAYSALITGKAVCQGYALAMCMLCRAVNIPCYAVASDERKHMWNVVYADGAWYQVDVTNDDNVPDMMGSAGHLYLLRSDAFMQSDENHAASDWHIFGTDSSITCNDDPYSGTFWEYTLDSVAPLSDGRFLVAVQNDPNKVKSSSDIGAALTAVRLGEEPESLQRYSAVWRTPSNGYYVNSYSYAEIWNNRIYYSTPTAIRSSALDGSDVQTFYTLTDSEKETGYIYGFLIDGNGLMTYQVMPKPAFSDLTTYTFDASYYTVQLPALPEETTAESTMTTESTTTTTTTESTTTTTTTESTTTTTETTTTSTETETTTSSTSSTRKTRPTSAETTTTTTESTTTAESATSDTVTTASSQETETTSPSAETTTTVSITSVSETTTLPTETTVSFVSETETTAQSTESTSETETTAAVSTVRGDLNLNGYTDLRDAVMLAKAIAGLEDDPLSVAARRNADCVADGILSQLDLTWLLRNLAGLDNP